ncbi:MAG: hypothetical protein BroJett040_02440 [Oligoflexia bacterium]|nr:MAG: hypothetical protein BroJett040_02440 [Oligoflexia bacterium]
MKFEFPEDMIVCMKDEKGQILFQNDKCVSICGELQGTLCSKGCMSHYNSETETAKMKNGFHFFHKKDIEGANYDIVILKRSNMLLSMLHPTQEVSSQAQVWLTSDKLTKREKEILYLRVCQGLTHKQICEKIYISRPTLRTHINNINKKLQGEKFDLSEERAN